MSYAYAYDYSQFKNYFVFFVIIKINNMLNAKHFFKYFLYNSILHIILLEHEQRLYTTLCIGHVVANDLHKLYNSINYIPQLYRKKQITVIT